METLILKSSELDTAAEIIKSGGLVAIPTETVYGLAADATNGTAVKNIYKAKGRPSDNPLIVHISCIEEIYPIVSEFPAKAKLLAKTFWPGPLTIVLPKSNLIPKETSGGLNTVAVRCPSHETARALIKKSGLPIAAPSANLSGSPSPTTFSHVINDLMGRVDAMIDGGDCSVGVESTVITFVSDIPRILRPGGITFEQIKSVIGETEIDSAVTNPLKDGEKVSSPGMKYKHYSPKADVFLIKASTEKFIGFLNEAYKKNNNIVAICFEEDYNDIKCPAISYGKALDHDKQARVIFNALREVDEKGYSLAYVHCPETDGMGLAVYNRLIRAAGFKIIEI